MVVHTAAALVNYVSVPQVIGGTVAAAGLWSVKAWAGGRKCTWEREWAGKMILIVGPPTATVLSLIDRLLRLPSPPQILYLPPLASPLPQDLLTILHTLRLSTSNPLAQLHCEPLPPTPRGVRDFVRKWSATPQGTASESGRRIDAIVIAEGFEVLSSSRRRKTTSRGRVEEDPEWTIHQFHFHFLTSLLPHLLRIQAERNIRIVSLVSPGWAAALPSLQLGIGGSRGVMSAASPLQLSGIKGLTTLLLMAHFQLILDTLASTTYGKARNEATKPVPVVTSEKDEATINKSENQQKQRDKSIKSNIMAVSVVMPWCRGDVIRGIWAADESWARWLMYMLWFPLLLIFTPSPAQSIQSVLFALSAPVRYDSRTTQPIRQALQPGEGSKGKEKTEEEVDPRRSGVAGGDTVRDCGVIDLPPVLCDPAVAKAHYDKIEKEVEEGVKQSQTREKAYPPKKPEAAGAGAGAEAEKDVEPVSAPVSS